MPTSRPLVTAINNDSAFLHLLEALLHDEGFDTLLLQTGDIALDTIGQHRPKLIILDVAIDDPSASWKLVDLLTLSPATEEIPLIICSVADQTLEDRRAKLLASGCAVVEKPFHLNELMDTIRAMLGTKDTE